ncbi:hypothetical protein HK102_010422 [Quaeritorhiza haematococci]|nr:hypothetical protein HK102_010422 [Quaeritorhiza haematococci]
MKLSLKGCHILTDVSLQLIGSYVAATITHLNLEGCFGVTDTTVRLLSNCTQLEFLNLNFLSLVTDDSMVPVATNCKKLAQIKLSDTAVTNATVFALSRNCRNLVEVHLKGITEVTDASVIDLVRFCPELYTLNLSGMKKVTGDSIRAIADHCKNIAKLDACSIAAPRDIWTYLVDMTDLDILYVDGCPGFSEEFAKRLRAKSLVDVIYEPEFSDEESDQTEDNVYAKLVMDHEARAVHLMKYYTE